MLLFMSLSALLWVKLCPVQLQDLDQIDHILFHGNNMYTIDNVQNMCTTSKNSYPTGLCKNVIGQNSSISLHDMFV